jgi:hypothetical protein
MKSGCACGEEAQGGITFPDVASRLSCCSRRDDLRRHKLGQVLPLHIAETGLTHGSHHQLGAIASIMPFSCYILHVPPISRNSCH